MASAPWCVRLVSQCCVSGFAYTTYALSPGQPSPGPPSLLRPPSHYKSCRNINLLPIDYAFRPRLRGRLTLPRLTLDRNPWSSGEEVFTPLSLLTSAFAPTTHISVNPRLRCLV